jgi:hypothetical protein
VPLHLLTREAVALYVDSLAPDGLLAFHASSAHFHLVPVILPARARRRLAAVDLESGRDPSFLLQPATWVFASRSEARIAALAEAARTRLARKARARP